MLAIDSEHGLRRRSCELDGRPQCYAADKPQLEDEALITLAKGAVATLFQFSVSDFDSYNF